MANTITLPLNERATAAFVALRSEGIDAAAIVEDVLVQRAADLRERAEEAAHLREDSMQRKGLDEARELPPQIEYMRPPR